MISIEEKLYVKDDCWAKISFSLIKDFCFNLKERFGINNLIWGIEFQQNTLSYKIKFDEVSQSALKKYINLYGFILLQKEPINSLFEGEALVNFKQSLDLSLLEFKLLKNDFEDKNFDNDEIFKIHYNLGEKFTQYDQFL